MNEIIVKKTAIFSLIIGFLSGIVALIPPFIGLVLFFLVILIGPFVILLMKKNDRHLGIINEEQGAILGGIVGFFSTVGFFLSFSPCVCILHLIFKKYYSYMIPDMLTGALWLFFILIFMVAGVFAATNAASAMGLAWIISRIEKKPDNYDANIDIKIED